MPLTIEDDLPTKFPSPDYLTLDSWKRGVITLLDKSKLPKDALEEADNLFLVEDGQPTLRPGVDWYGVAMPNGLEVDGFDYFDFAGAIHLLAVAGGTIYRSTDDGANWTPCTGATLTVGKAVSMNQSGAFMYFTTGSDAIVRYDGTTVLSTYVALSTPSAPTVAETGLTGTGYNYYYKVSAVNTVGFSAASSASPVVQASLARDTWDSTTNFAVITVPAFQPTQTRADIYISENDIDYYYLASTSVSGATFKDDGTAIPVTATLAPTGNTSQGPKVAELTNVGSRMFGVRDADNRYRIWFSGAGNFAGSFSSAYDGGYLDWQEGGKFYPIHCEDYRDGKGTPLATIWCDSADGQGCILQMSLDTLTIGDISITVPSAYKLPGSRGTPSPGSVVNVLNDYMFYNSQAFYNLGSRAQFLNLLSTDEASANIRPSVKRITTATESMIASVYFDAKVYFSVGYGSSVPNATAIYDTERKAWLPKAFTIGFKKFLRYTDTGGTHRLLAIKPGDNRLSEVSSGIKGDYGVPFATSLLTGLYATSKNRFGFQWMEDAEIEFSNPQGTISIELIGIERKKGFRTTNSETIQSSISTTGWDSYMWDERLWDDTSDAEETFSESSTKKYFRINKELNAIQWGIRTSDIDSDYVLRTLQAWGTDTLGGKPRDWKI
jgi:hypothetical protein